MHADRQLHQQRLVESGSGGMVEGGSTGQGGACPPGVHSCLPEMATDCTTVAHRARTAANYTHQRLAYDVIEHSEIEFQVWPEAAHAYGLTERSEYKTI